MNDIDRTLARLASDPVPAALGGIEADVLARIAAGSTARDAGLGIGVVAIAAVAIRMAGANLSSSAGQMTPLSPLGGGSPHAPSTLLADVP